MRHPPPAPAHLHHRVVAKAPLGATQHRPPINIDGPPALVGNEEVTIVFQLDDTCRGRKEKKWQGGDKQEKPSVPLLPGYEDMQALAAPR